MTNPAEFGERIELSPEVVESLTRVPVEHNLVLVDHLRRPTDHLTVVGVGPGSAYVVANTDRYETARALQAIADALLLPDEDDDEDGGGQG